MPIFGMFMGWAFSGGMGTFPAVSGTETAADGALLVVDPLLGAIDES